MACCLNCTRIAPETGKATLSRRGVHLVRVHSSNCFYINSISGTLPQQCGFLRALCVLGGKFVALKTNHTQSGDYPISQPIKSGAWGCRCVYRIVQLLNSTKNREPFSISYTVSNYIHHGQVWGAKIDYFIHYTVCFDHGCTKLERRHRTISGKINSFSVTVTKMVGFEKREDLL